MIRGQKVLAVVPARGGSKGIPRKNLRLLRDKPLVAWTFEAAVASAYIDDVILSSDDAEIISVVRELGWNAPFVRDSRLATETASTADVILDSIARCPGFDWVVVLQPTSPLRTTEDIDGCLELCVSLGAPACVSVSEVEESPYWMVTMGDNARLRPLLTEVQFTRRQDLPPVYSLNGAVYVASIPWFEREKRFVSSETVGFVMTAERSHDIDTEQDFARVESVLGGFEDVPLPETS
jgi:CMP-N,N'-diacetyllegionaminic acid synthase